MEQRECGRSGLRLSLLGLGCWAFGGGEYWGPHEQTDVDGVVRRAFELGITYFDTAEVYNDGRSEAVKELIRHASGESEARPGSSSRSPPRGTSCSGILTCTSSPPTAAERQMVCGIPCRSGTASG
jgi:hypothetical protein